MNIELQRADQPEITEYPEAELEILRREIALEQSGVEPKLAIEHILITKFGPDYRYEDLTEAQRNSIRDTTLEAFSRHIENPNHAMHDDTTRSQVLLLWAKLRDQDVGATADMFSVEDDEIDSHALEGLRYICNELPRIPEGRFKKIAPILSDIQIQIPEIAVVPGAEELPEEPESEKMQEPLPDQTKTEQVGSIAVAQEVHPVAPDKSDKPSPAEDDTAAKSNRQKHFTVPGVSPDESKQTPPINYTEDVIPLTPAQIENPNYEKIMWQKIINHRILSREEITELSEDIEIGLIARHKLEHMPGPDSGSDSEARLREELQVLATIGDEAKDKLVRHNLRLVMRIATPYQRRANHLDFTDIFAEGTLGLIRAVEKYDYKKGYTLSTYATWWIKKYIRTAIHTTDRSIYLPENIHLKWQKITTGANNYKEEFGIEANDTELAAYIDMSLDDLALVRNSMSRTISLNTPMGEKGDEDIGDLLYDASEKTTESAALEIMLPTAETLCGIIAKHVSGTAKKTEAARALFLHCGLPLHSGVFGQDFIDQHDIEPGKAYSLEAIGEMLSLSRATVQLRIAAARDILAEPHVMSLLRDITAK